MGNCSKLIGTNSPWRLAALHIGQWSVGADLRVREAALSVTKSQFMLYVCGAACCDCIAWRRRLLHCRVSCFERTLA
eukprot:4508957-Alexandrium_andersonii.AAC.1